MAPPHAQRPREIVQQALPPLDRGAATTRSAAWGENTFKGKLQHWDTFEADVRARYDAIHWTNHVISHTSGQPPRLTSTETEQVAAGDEIGVQTRLMANIGHPMGAVCRAGAINLKFGAYMATVDRLTGSRKPDIAIMTRAGLGRAFGEIKTPWVLEHKLSIRVIRGGTALRQAVAHAARYMKTAGLCYGFVSTYDETIFLKQEVLNGEWTLLYSNAIDGGNKSSASGGKPRVAVRECFWHFLNLINEGHGANNTVPWASWVAQS